MFLDMLKAATNPLAYAEAFVQTVIHHRTSYRESQKEFSSELYISNHAYREFESGVYRITGDTALRVIKHLRFPLKIIDAAWFSKFAVDSAWCALLDVKIENGPLYAYLVENDFSLKAAPWTTTARRQPVYRLSDQLQEYPEAQRFVVNHGSGTDLDWARIESLCGLPKGSVLAKHAEFREAHDAQVNEARTVQFAIKLLADPDVARLVASRAYLPVNRVQELAATHRLDAESWKRLDAAYRIGAP